jgi:hypothetical protein
MYTILQTIKYIKFTKLINLYTNQKQNILTRILPNLMPQKKKLNQIQHKKIQ